MPDRFRLTLMIALCCLFWAVLGALLSWLFLAPYFGFFVGLLFGIGYTSFGYWASDRFALDLYEAEILDPVVAPRFYEMVYELSAQAGLEEPPLVYAIPLKAPNAFVIVRRDGVAAVAVTHGLTEALEREEVRAILALMISRIAGGEAESWTVASALAGLPLHGARSAGVNDTLYNHLEIDPAAGLTVFGKLLLTFFLPPCAFALRLVFSPGAVINSDARAVRLTGDPSALASALAKIQGSLPLTGWGASGYNPATALLFAVPPLPPPSAIKPDAPFWMQVQRSYPYQHADVAERSRLLAATPSRGTSASPERQGAA